MQLHELENTIWAGEPMKEAKKVLLLLHGRGADARDILSIAPYLTLKNFALVAPQATNHQWYPYSFLEKPGHNEPWLSSALDLFGALVKNLQLKGISSEHIYISGFSQGACLALEFASRHAQTFGGVAAFTGGLIGDKIYSKNYQGDFGQTPVFLSTGNPDPHVPVQRVNATAALLESMNADVLLRIYPNRPHTISADELMEANKFIFDKD